MASKKEYQSSGGVEAQFDFKGNPMEVKKFSVDASNSPATGKSTSAQSHGHKNNA